jgi:lysophospholipase L1-like esterase
MDLSIRGRCSAILAFFLMTAMVRAQPSAPFLHRNDVVLFQGDSITDGGRWRTGDDLNHIMGQDYAYLLAAKLGAEHPDLHLTFLNRGISGDRITTLSARWQADTLALKPNVLSILVGINDTLSNQASGESTAQYEQGYDQLLSNTLAALHGIKIVLGEPFLLPVGKHRATYASELAELNKRQAVVEKLAAKYHLPIVRYQRAFDAACRDAPPEYWSWDGVHPTYAGHWLMMQTWLAATDAFWPK